MLFLVPPSGKDVPRPGASFPLGGIFLSGRLGVVFLVFVGETDNTVFEPMCGPWGIFY